MNILGWIIWGLFCTFAALFLLGDLLTDSRSRLKWMMEFVMLIGVATGLCITAIWNVSKFHLLWFVPLSCFLSMGIARFFWSIGLNRCIKRELRRKPGDTPKNADDIKRVVANGIEEYDNLKK